jgi:hypothetical protein
MKYAYVTRVFAPLALALTSLKTIGVLQAFHLFRFIYSLFQFLGGFLAQFRFGTFLGFF